MVGKKKTKMKKINNLSYLRVSLEFEEPTKCEITRDLFSYIITSAVTTLHGEVTAAEPLDILEFNQETLQATISCNRQSLEKVWSALTLYGSFNEQRCLFHISQTFSPITEQVNHEGHDIQDIHDLQESN